MNNQICEIFSRHNILLRDLRSLDFSKYSKKRNFKLFFGVDTKKMYTVVFLRFSKSKFLQKDLLELDDICLALESEFDTNIKKRVLLYKSSICSKVLKNNNLWTFYDFM